MLSYLARRLREPSTWAGIGSLLITAAGAVNSSDPAAAAGAVVAALVAIGLPEKSAR